MKAELQVAKIDHVSLPPLRLGVTLPQLRFFISPARLQRIMRVLHAAMPGVPHHTHLFPTSRLPPQEILVSQVAIHSVKSLLSIPPGAAARKITLNKDRVLT